MRHKNRFLYKYMPLREREDFFIDPIMIRATPVSALNDPFEGQFNPEQLRDADRNQRDYYQKNGMDVHEVDEVVIDGIMGTKQSDISALGILSFTEVFNNPLMWAHYADAHKGMVIEFDFNEPFFMDSLKEVDGRKSRFGKNFHASCFEFPEKVNYSRLMPSFERPELSAPQSMDVSHWEKFNRTILFTKSDVWNYEKEHRIIVQLKGIVNLV